jgi:hypothetical protein
MTSSALSRLQVVSIPGSGDEPKGGFDMCRFAGSFYHFVAADRMMNTAPSPRAASVSHKWPKRRCLARRT